MATTFLVDVQINVLPEVLEQTVSYTVNFDIQPPVYKFNDHILSTTTTLNINPVTIKLREILSKISSKLIGNKISTFYDEDRSLKTLLNFGNDLQFLVTNWKYNEDDQTGSSIVLKLYKPLSSFISEKDTAWISTEISPPLIDQLWIQNTPQVGQLLYLRPSFTNIELSDWNGTTTDNATLTSLYSSSNTSTLLSNRNDVLEQYYTTDLRGVSLNVDYKDYKNFIHFGSAEERLLAFATKLESINVYDTYIQQQSSSLAYNSASVDYNFLTSSVVFKTLQDYENRKIEIIRSFDGYERFMYYETGIPYSGTLSSFDVDTIYYHTDATWPKSGSILYPVTSASINYATKYGKSYINETSNDILPLQAIQPWLDNQLYIAREYDNQNYNALVNNIPRYIIDEDKSPEFIKFVSMIGHHFDNVKPYIDAMTSISDRSNSPNTGLSSNLVWHIAKSTGFDLPSEYTLRKLQDYVIGNSTLDPLFYSSGEIWKRILHNQIHILKTKGTAESINALMNSYGITPGILQIREGVTPSTDLTSSFSSVDETTYALNCISGSYIDITLANIVGPVSSSILTPNSFEVRFATKNLQNDKLVLLNGMTNQWALILTPTDLVGNGVVSIEHMTTGSIVASSSILPIFNGNYHHVSIVYNSTGSMLYINEFDGKYMKYSSSVSISSSFDNCILGSSRVAVGGSGSLFGIPFSGSIDEFRVWGYPISYTYIDHSTKHPGLYSGDYTSSAADSLFVKLSFNKIKNLFATSSVENESPYIRFMTGSTPLLTFDARYFTNISTSPYNFTKITRTILKYELTSTGNRFATNNVIISDDATFKNVQFVDSTISIPALRVDKSLKLISEKVKYPQPNNYIGIYFSIADTINDSILRSTGYIDLEQLIGDPEDMYSVNYSLLRKLSEYYWKHYSFNFNNNALIDYIGGSFAGFFKQIKGLIPVRAKLISGHVIEPHMLERSKIQYRKSNVQGDTRNSNSPELFSENVLIDVGTPITSPYNPLQDIHINMNSDYIVLSPSLIQDEGSIDTYNDLITLTSNVEDLNSQIDTITDILRVESDINDIDTNLNLNITNIIESELTDLEAMLNLPQSDYGVVEPTNQMYDEYIAKEMYILYLLSRFGVTSPLQLPIDSYNLYKQQLASFRPGMVLRIMDTYDKYNNLREGIDQSAFSNYRDLSVFIYDTIQHISDFSRKETTTFFMNLSGVYVDYENIRVRYLNNILVSKGNWSAGSTYFKNDYVLYTFNDGSTREYRCITIELNKSFISTISPDLDYNNWEPVGYINERRIKIKKVIELNNEIEIVRNTHTNPGFSGYSKKHYKYHRFNSLGMRRSKYLGCVQDNTTTLDGKDPIETTVVKTDQIFVNPDINSPVQRSDNLSGPILDVR